MSDLVNQLMKEIYKCYEITKQKHESCCTTRSQLLYIALKHSGFKPRMLRYLNSEEQENRIKIKLISGEEFESHVVILLNNKILDSNLSERIPKKDYERKIKEINAGMIIISKDYWTNPNIAELKEICYKCDLSHLFIEALKNPQNSKPN